MGILWSNSKWLWATAIGLFYCLASCSGDSEECNDWPLLTTYKWTDKMFSCSGSITGFVMCNKGNGHTDVAISLWRGGNVYRTSVVYLHRTHVRDFSDNYLSFSSGDQLMVLVIYYESSISCSLPVEVTTDSNPNCPFNKSKLYLKGTQDCFTDIPDEDAGNADTTCPPASYTMPNVSLMPCINPPSMDSSSVQDAAQPPSTPRPGLVAAIVLGIVLVILVMACAVAWVVCFKRKKRKLKADRRDGVNFSEVLQTHNSAELYESPVFNEPQYEMTCTSTSAESLPEEQKSKNGYYNTTQQYSELPSAYLLEENHYWLPAATLSGIKAQMHQKAAHSLELQPESITLLEELGKGEFGMVYKGEWTSSPGGPVQVAVKTLHSQEEENRYKLLKEAAIMGQFNHPNVVRLYGVIDKPNKVMLIMEFLSRGDLLNHLNKCRCQPLQEDHPLQLLRFCQEIADAMDYLSKKGFSHRDLAARNILLNEEHTAKIADFGLSHDMDEDYYYKPKGGMIPVKWTAPEAVLYKKYTTKSDVWSYGMVMYEMWSLGHKPFETFSINQVLKAFETGYCQPPPPGCPRNIYKLMADCWNPDHHSRPTFEDITRELATDPEVLLSWSQQDKATSSKAAVLGAPLEEGKHLYQELQDKYQ